MFVCKLLNILYPPVCPFCGEILSADSYGICNSCKERLPYVQEPRCMKCGKTVWEEEKEYCRDCAAHTFAYEQGRSVWHHTGAVPSAIYQWKFHNKRCYTAVFAKEMAKYCGHWVIEKKIEEIIPVPLHPARRRKRGFNQAGLLAEELGKLLSIPVNQKAVFRVKNTRPQKTLDARKRQDNLRGAFGISPDWKASCRVLIIDDIYTTGNTIHRVAKLLKTAGAQKVYFLTISIGQGL